MARTRGKLCTTSIPGTYSSVSFVATQTGAVVSSGTLNVLSPAPMEEDAIVLAHDRRGCLERCLVFCVCLDGCPRGRGISWLLGWQGTWWSDIWQAHRWSMRINHRQKLFRFFKYIHQPLSYKSNGSLFVVNRKSYRIFNHHHINNNIK